MKKAERTKLKGLLDYFRQQGGEGSAEVIAELESCLHQGRVSEELLAAISGRISRNEELIQQNLLRVEGQVIDARENAQIAGLTLASFYGDLLPLILPLLASQIDLKS